MLQGCVSYFTRVYIACVFCVRAAGLFDCACMLGLRVIVCRFQACVHIRRVYIAGVVCFRGFGLFACVGLLVLRVMVYVFVLMCCKVLFHIASA